MQCHEKQVSLWYAMGSSDDLVVPRLQAYM